MDLSPDQFAEQVRALRPVLVRSALRWRRCSYEEAEDLVSEAVRLALRILPRAPRAIAVNGLRGWLRAILYRVVLRDKRISLARPSTVPLSEVEEMPADHTAAWNPGFEETLRCLPRTHRAVLRDWLVGYETRQIARRRRLHRNTVAFRLQEAFSILRGQFTDARALESSFTLFALGSRTTIYRKPMASWRPWRDQHPPEKPFRRPRGRSA